MSKPAASATLAATRTDHRRRLTMPASCPPDSAMMLEELSPGAWLVTACQASGLAEAVVLPANRKTLAKAERERVETVLRERLAALGWADVLAKPVKPAKGGKVTDAERDTWLTEAEAKEVQAAIQKSGKVLTHDTVP